jgi:protein TonB
VRKPQFLAVLACAGLAVLAAAQTAKTPKRLRVSPRVAEELKTHSVDPTYPRESRDKGIQGEVILQATIDTKGNIGSLKAVKGDPILADASIEAVKQWKYKPFLLDGEPIEVETTIKVVFHM